MPADGMQWWHVIISTHNSWLPGDKRGFRSRKHKIHSSGDYKNPPPIEEHAALRAFHQQNAGDPVTIPADLYETVGGTILAKLKKGQHRILALSVAATHSHWLVELPTGLKETRAIVGQFKTVSSHAIRAELPGQVWASRGSFIPIKDHEHQLNVYRYILNQKDAWIWHFSKEDEDEEGKEQAQG